jgi:signal transduction histidine kinase
MDIAEHPFFENVDESQKDELIKLAQIESYPTETMIFEQGSLTDGFYLVLEGEVAFLKKIPGAEFRAVGYSSEGSSFGEIGLFTGDPRAVRAESRGEVVIAKIAGPAFVDFIKNAPGRIDNILESVVRHLNETTRHYMEDMLKQEKMAVVGTMVNTIIHDFKNPFCLISLASQLLMQLHDDEKTQKLCTNIEDQIQRMVGMAEELNGFSKGHHDLHVSQVDLHGLIERFKELNFPFFQDEKVKIEFDVPNLEIEGEENKLIRVLQNLVGNALDAFEDRGGAINVTGEMEGDNTLLLKVSDNGNGIPEEIRHHFFEAFVTFGKSKGTGLGSAIVKSIVEAHGGSISFQTENGKGTTFFVRLPIRQAVPHA